MEYLGIEGYLGYLLMSCIVSFVLILCSILSLQDKRIKTYKLSFSKAAFMHLLTIYRLGSQLLKKIF